LLTRSEADRPDAKCALDEPWLAEDASTWDPSHHIARRMRASTTDYTSVSFFAKVALNCVASQLDAAQLDGIDKAFTAIDVNHDGELSLDELSSGLKRLGVDPVTAGQLGDALDVNGDGSISYTEFTASLLKSQSLLAETQLRCAFDIFDVDHNGSISLDELRLMLGRGPLASILPDGKTPDAVLKEVDTSHDGAISFSEFKNYLLQETSAPAAAARRRTSEIVPNFGSEGVHDVLRRMCVEIGRSEEDGSHIARRLVEDHYISTMADLAELRDIEDWERLELPMKLERLLRACCQRMCC